MHVLHVSSADSIKCCKIQQFWERGHFEVAGQVYRSRYKERQDGTVFLR